MSKAVLGTIVIAWTESVTDWDGEPYARDLGQRPGLVEVTIPKACVWINRGTEKDLAAARKHVASEGIGVVLVYPTRERDPIVRAKVDIMRAVKKVSS